MARKLGGYGGNPYLRLTGIKTNFTDLQLEEYVRCSEDCMYFVEKYCRITTLDHGVQPFKLRDYQREFLNLILNNNKLIAKQARTEW